MKKIISIFMILILIFSLTGCDKNSPEYLLNNFNDFSETVSQMSRDEIGDKFGYSPGWIEEPDCEVYLDSWGNGIFVYFSSEDRQRVERVEKEKYRNRKITDSSTKEETLLYLLNKELGKYEEDIIEKYGEPIGRNFGIYGTEHNINGFEVTFSYGMSEEGWYVGHISILN